MLKLTDAFTDMGIDYIPSAGNFVCLKTNRPGIELYLQLLQRGVIVRPIDNYGLPDHVRITIGTPGDNQRLLGALHEVLSK